MQPNSGGAAATAGDGGSEQLAAALVSLIRDTPPASIAALGAKAKLYGAAGGLAL
eukprot:gene5601-439_t